MEYDQDLYTTYLSGCKVIKNVIFFLSLPRYNNPKYVFTMNLRVFKKDIKYFVEEFIDDCYFFRALNPHKDSDEIFKLIDEAAELHNDLMYRANHPEGKKRAYYNSLVKEMFEKLDALCEKLSAVASK